MTARRVLVVAVLALAVLGGARSGPRVLESDNASLLTAYLKVVRNRGATIAVKNTTMIELLMHEGDFSCEQTGEYGSLGGHKWTEPWETGGVASTDDASVLSPATLVIIGRGCRACIYNEISGETLMKPVDESKKERVKNWRFLQCPELLDKLRSIGLAEPTVVQFAKVLSLSPTGEPVKGEAAKPTTK